MDLQYNRNGSDSMVFPSQPQPQLQPQGGHDDSQPPKPSYPFTPVYGQNKKTHGKSKNMQEVYALLCEIQLLVWVCAVGLFCFCISQPHGMYEDDIDVKDAKGVELVFATRMSFCFDCHRFGGYIIRDETPLIRPRIFWILLSQI